MYAREICHLHLKKCIGFAMENKSYLAAEPGWRLENFIALSMKILVYILADPMFSTQNSPLLSTSERLYFAFPFNHISRREFHALYQANQLHCFISLRSNIQIQTLIFHNFAELKPGLFSRSHSTHREAALSLW